jgi:hypothetical protein
MLQGGHDRIAIGAFSDLSVKLSEPLWGLESEAGGSMEATVPLLSGEAFVRNAKSR